MRPLAQAAQPARPAPGIGGGPRPGGARTPAQPPGSGIGATHSHTPVWQWIVLCGEQAALAVAGLALLGRRRAALKAVMVLAHAACGIGFALVYLKEIYSSDYCRGNSAFKFGFQAFLSLTPCACVVLAMLAHQTTRASWRPAVAVLPLGYGWFVVNAALGTWRQRDWSLDGGRHLARFAEDAQIVRWLDPEVDARRGALYCTVRAMPNCASDADEVRAIAAKAHDGLCWARPSGRCTRTFTSRR